ETHLPKTEQPTEENGYNYFGSTAPSEWYNEEGRLVRASTVPTDFIKEKLGDRNYYGIFTVGANNYDVTFRFLADGECKLTVTIPSGVIPTLPELLKSGYTLTSWTLGEETNYDPGSPLVVGNETENVDIYAVYTPNTYKITFDFGYNKTEAEQTFGEALSLPEVIERAGYTFVGWFTLANGEGEQLTDGANFMTDENVTYYAFYTPIEITPPSEFPVVPVIVISAVVLLIVGGAVWFFILRRRKENEPIPVTPADAPVPSAISTVTAKIVKTRYTDEEIEKIVAATAETHLLTNRELEVFCELLKGKKQSEIGYYLGISISTVKDNAGRIYGKLGVANKDELFIKVDSKLRKS
ncbi:MAG: InlB B-repeat-containing protein, partial [Clostridia bacterium]|nr:InlB B-repeat-containing protein [Clostridia bacterium]